MNSNTTIYRIAHGIGLVILALVVCLTATAGAAAAPAMHAAPPRMPSAGLTDPQELEAFLDDLLAKAALVIALVATALTAGLVACAGLAWKRHYWSVVGRAHYSLVTLGALAFIWFLNYWNLLGFRW